MRIFNRLTLIALVLMVSTPAAGAPLLFLPTQHFDDSDSEFFDLFVVNPLSGQIERTLPWRGASRAMDSMRERIFLASETELSVLDVATLEVLESTPLGFEPRSMIVDPVHQELYVAAARGGEFAVFDLDTLELTNTFINPASFSLSLGVRGKASARSL